MGGVNPYIAKPEAKKPTKRFMLTLIDEATKETTVIEVDPEKIPYSHTGQDGSILDIALGSGVEINHSCGGVCACSTCHVIVQQGFNSCSKSTVDEDEELDNAPGLTIESRLACQCVPDGTEDLVVVIPAWNKNLVKEGH